jgi:hypothetical protein
MFRPIARQAVTPRTCAMLFRCPDGEWSPIYPYSLNKLDAAGIGADKT